MARRKYDQAVEVRVEALDATQSDVLTGRLVLWSTIAAFAALMMSWVNTIHP